MVRKLLAVLLLSFLLNFIWEHLHSALYVSYQGGAITNFILLKAALFDASVITLVAYLTLSLFGEGGVGEGVALVFVLLIFAILLEKWALGTGRWVYANAMPIVPLLNVGLTPTIQLGFLGCLSFKISDFLTGTSG